MRHKTHVDLPEDVRKKLVDVLDTQLANTIDLFMMIKQAHWTVRGPQFFARHELFDNVANHYRDFADDIAERIATLGGYPDGTVRMVAERTKLEPYDTSARSGQQHVRVLVSRMASHLSGMRAAVEMSATMKDPATEDLLTEQLRAGEMDLWFLESHLES